MFKVSSRVIVFLTIFCVTVYVFFDKIQMIYLQKFYSTSTAQAHQVLPGYNVVSQEQDNLYTKNELSKYDGGIDSPGLYLAILGRVYDVSAGKKHYGEGGGYAFFRGTSMRLNYYSYCLRLSIV